LIACPDLWLKRALKLDPRWFDGNPVNGEIGADGVHFLAPDGNAVEFTLQYPKRREHRTLTPDENARREIQTSLRAWQRESEAQRRAQALLERPTFLMAIEGSAGPAGLDISPQLMPLSFDQETLPLYRSPLETSN
jgi:hypothetical protein